MEPDRPAMSLLDDGHWVPSRSEPAPGPFRTLRHPAGADLDPPHGLGNAGMVDDQRNLGTIPRSHEARSGPASTRSAPAAVIQDLQGLRQWVLDRLDSLEALARQRGTSAAAGGDIPALERTLQQRLDELEEARSRLCAEVERQEKDWSASLNQLEADRRLLAEAWERIERQRIEGFGTSPVHPHPHAQGQASPRGVPAAVAHPVVPAPARSAASDSDANNPVAQAVLRQFQTLCRDVRCNAEARRDSL
jgi:hypothetical protein